MDSDQGSFTTTCLRGDRTFPGRLNDLSAESYQDPQLIIFMPHPTLPAFSISSPFLPRSSALPGSPMIRSKPEFKSDLC